MKIAKHINGERVVLLVGDELIRPGIPQHKMRYVGPIGPYGEDVVDPPKGQPTRFVHLDVIPDRDQLVVGERGTTDWYEAQQIQARALDIVRRGVVNHWLWPNCEHIGSHIRHGKAESPQLRIAAGVGVAVLLWWGFGG